MSVSPESRLDLGTVLTNVDGERFLVLDAIGGKLKLVRVPPTLRPEDYGIKFRHVPEPGDPTRCQLMGSEDD